MVALFSDTALNTFSKLSSNRIMSANIISLGRQKIAMHLKLLDENIAFPSH